ncbi:sigma-70 family RNA polymerase sigma factor [Aestuariivirga sp. YIM B02566]|uniref:Sigma-70 family RNA polymerase sigma factor n=1 Tax=Taklimakanibacter albus TaxID=2800327 RepID=A0ACC5RF40_9HYPH|nr:sigma-70 family RNA polymerase sigma factor [Aestuariivirga sp. YIM B02566]MBK1871267.1 sigma-70 family RNA polymerase sigma factor [Aestuariivirga sp. YIM B02566]
MNVAYRTDWTNAETLPRGYADQRIVAELPMLRKYALRLTRSAHLADDLVQDCVARALSRRHLFHSEANLRPWLFTVMHNLHVSHCRQMAVRTTYAVAQMKVATEGREATQEHVTDLNRAIRVVALLPKEQREVVTLVTLQELSYQEAADMLGIPVGTVMSRLARGRDKIRALLKPKIPVARRRDLLEGQAA